MGAVLVVLERLLGPFQDGAHASPGWGLRGDGNSILRAI